MKTDQKIVKIQYPCCEEVLANGFSDIRSIADPEVTPQGILTHTICPHCGTHLEVILEKPPASAIRLEVE
ncbi:hypothetical protein [Natrononativus amylolyticus]|uniref:hypothetical protein n=1 Tax=Natrononativus amylolyticus TaxID=2963434 RepID=UPI0020CBD0BF|nr:hypothetical protein [Natrononativus amylolyticus]